MEFYAAMIVIMGFVLAGVLISMAWRTAGWYGTGFGMLGAVSLMTSLFIVSAFLAEHFGLEGIWATSLRCGLAFVPSVALFIAVDIKSHKT